MAGGVATYDLRVLITNTGSMANTEIGGGVDGDDDEAIAALKGDDIEDDDEDEDDDDDDAGGAAGPIVERVGGGGSDAEKNAQTCSAAFAPISSARRCSDASDASAVGWL